MEEKKQYSALTIDRAAFLLLRVKKAFKKKKLQRKEREKSAQQASNSRNDQRASCAGLEMGRIGGASGGKKAPPPLLRSRTLPAIVVPGVNILQAQIDGLSPPPSSSSKTGSFSSRFHSTRVSFSRDDTMALDLRRKSAVSRLCGTGNYGPERGPDGTLLLRVPAPHVVAARAYRIQNTNTTNTSLFKLSKLLPQSGTSTKNHIIVDDTNVTRRLSWERRDTINSRLPRSSSIDSMVEAVWAECSDNTTIVESASISQAVLPNDNKRPSLRPDRTLALVSPSVGRRMKGQRGINELPTLPSDLEMEVANNQPLNGLPPPGHKPSKKEAKLIQQRLEHLAKVNIHLHALFTAVEHSHLEKARTILESSDVDVNSLNKDELSPLDVAVLSNNRPLAKMLIKFGAQEGNRFSSPEQLGNHLKRLMNEAEMRLQEFGGLLDEPCTTPLNTRASFSSIIGNAYPSSAMTGCAGGDTEKQALAWNRRAKTLKRLLLGFTQARPPDPPSLVAVDITGPASVLVRLQEPTGNDSAIATKFRVQWSTKADFSIITGEKDILNIAEPNCTIDLTHGRRYFFRAACGNLKGFGTYLSATPSFIIPSSWREIDNKEQRFSGRLKQLDSLMDEVKQIRPPGCSTTEMLEMKDQPPSSSTSSSSTNHSHHHHHQRRTQRKKTTIKQLFTAASKFQKHLRRGIYLACILYHEDKVLVTNEDFLPVIEIDETFPSCIYTDLYWLMKVACTWDDTKLLRSDLEKHSSSTVHFRTKLLSAALQMQSSLCLQDLGQLYHKPLRDSNGTTVVLSTINYVKTPKSVSVLNSRWLPMSKVFKKNVLSDDHNMTDILMASIKDQIAYHQASSLKLPKGLYLAYLKMQSSVDLIQVVVSVKSPNMLPHCKIRDNPHVSKEEWEYLKQQHLPDILDNATELQRTFLELVTSAAKRLFNYMDISNEDANTHRLYDAEVIDLTNDVSFIVICPSAEFSCSVPGQREILLQHGDLLSLPIQVFEMIHLNTYQHNIIKKYSKLSCLLELDAATANHLHREAFSNTELAIAKERLTTLQNLQSKLNTIWKSVRWLMDVITFARDRNSCGISMRYILEKEITTTNSPKRCLLQIPTATTPTTSNKIVKTSPGRGSWPGPSANIQNTSGNLMNEFSKSEQHLCINNETTSSQYLNAYSDPESRKNSDSYSSDYFTQQLPPSRSEDMLFNIPNQQQQQPSSSSVTPQRCRASTVSSISAASSPLLNVRPMYGGSLVSVNTLNTTNTSDSLHSLSSDSDSTTNQLLLLTSPNKSKRKQHEQQKNMPNSRSMTNVKQNILDINCCNHNNKYQRPKHLNVVGHLLQTNLETNLSKSLTNIRTDDIEGTTKQDDLFKIPPPPPPPLEPIQSTSKDTQQQPSSSSSGILQVFAAYETGLASGTSLKLHVTPRTTAREVVDLVVKQLNMTVVLKGKGGPVYSVDKLKNFCLVAVIGARERCLRDDFKPLQLQNPWKKGRLYVRQKQDVLAALEHSSKHGNSTII